MAVLTPIPAAPADATAAAPSASGPSCSLQRSGSLWQLGIEAQELTTAIGQLAEQLEADDPEQRALALAELESALLAEEGNKAALAAKCPVSIRLMAGVNLVDRLAQFFRCLLIPENAVGIRIVTRAVATRQSSWHPGVNLGAGGPIFVSPLGLRCSAAVVAFIVTAMTPASIR